MIASREEFGPCVPLPERFEIESEGGEDADGFMIDLVSENLYRVHRFGSRKSPLSVYANY